MIDEDEASRRVRFFGVHDLAAGWYAPRAAELAARFDPDQPLTNVVDVLELHNVAQYLEHGLIPSSYGEEEHAGLRARAPQIRSAVARFFSTVDNSNFADVVRAVDYEYHEDLLDLLGRNKAYERCAGESALLALKAAGVHFGEMLGSKKLVQAYSAQVREELVASPRNAEILIRKYLEKDARRAVYLPAGFTPEDARQLLKRYIDHADANLNYVRLISNANDHPDAGIDAKLRLHAKRRSEELNAKLFEHNVGFKTSCEVAVSEEQSEPVLFEMDSREGVESRYTYGRSWLDQTTDNPSILNNFQHLFEFADRHVLLTLPAYPAQLGVFERLMGLTGSTEYKVGVEFRNADARSWLQTHMYWRFLESKNIEIESVFSWFFEAYLVEEFGLQNFSFTPSARGTSFLQRVRHLFAEMESSANQFRLFVENGELDRDLLTMDAEQVRYKAIPSLLDGKYLYPAESGEVVGILHLLFSDQSRLTYIRDDLRATNAVELLLKNSVGYADFLEHQKESIDHLINRGVLTDSGQRVQFSSLEQITILATLFRTEAANYYHLSTAGRVEADRMVARGWLTRRSSLLTEAESDYFNFFLNRVRFSNGPNLRNRYVHGSQARTDGDDLHADAYVTALRMIAALIIKINDDLCLSGLERPEDGALSRGPSERGRVA